MFLRIHAYTYLYRLHPLTSHCKEFLDLLDPCYSMFLVESKCNIPNLSNKVVHDFTLIFQKERLVVQPIDQLDIRTRLLIEVQMSTLFAWLHCMVGI